ncbi:MAG: serine/threonine protein kinase, partial [Oscillibacter sp.]|nr:serine/threonine protein kinase [Oscillibacter sp.]
MPQVIASTYEILKEIGAGGGGVVYLGRHLRLDKLIVLKADKRSLKASPEMLRREVDALKNLTHTYIPQVYDFVQEDGVVYTVMDYIEGESLDKPLKRGDHIPQSQVIEWACELLEALRYLHSRPPHGILHSDIKPANVMVTPQGDIRLIDFNIALALGEEGAVRVGRSLGYASPEHFGEDYTEGDSRTRTGGGTRVERQRGRAGAEPGTAAAFHTGGTGTEVLPPASARSQSSPSPADAGTPSGVSYSSGHTVLLDVRSDIYSMGATLYHLLTGERPAQKVQEIKPITSFQNRNISPAVADIITKAMNPNPDRRYQTAEEMLSAFEHLHERDARTRRRRRHIAMTAAAALLVALLGSAMAYVGLRQSDQQSKAAVLAGESRDALRNGDVDTALSLALEALPEEQGILDPPYVPAAQLALANALGVYDLTDGYKPFRAIHLESSGTALKPVKAKLSPDGTKAAALVNSQGSWQILIYDTESGNPAAPPLAAEASSLTEFFFRDDGTFLYAGQNGLTLYDLGGQRELWSTGERAADIALSADGRVAATVYRDEPVARVYAADTGDRLYTVDLGRRDHNLYLTEDGRLEPLDADAAGENHMPYTEGIDVLLDRNDNLFALDADGSWLAVSFADGAVRLFCMDESMPDRTVLMPYETDSRHFEGGFCGSYFAVAASGGTLSSFRAVDLDRRVDALIRDSKRTFHILADESGIYLSDLDYVAEIEMASDEILRGIASADSEILSFYRV